MMSVLTGVLDAVGVCCAVAGVAAGWCGREDAHDLLLAAGNTLFIPGDAAGVNFFWMLPANAGFALFFLYCWRRRHRRGPGRAARSYGAKSRARLAAVVRTMRERARPRPVFRPQQQGA